MSRIDKLESVELRNNSRSAACGRLCPNEDLALKRQIRNGIDRYARDGQT